MPPLVCLGLLLGGCALLVPPPQLVYHVEVEPVLPEGEEYYIDPIDSSVVWSKEGILVKVRFYNDQMLDAQYDPRVSPYTLTGWKDPELGYTPPLWTVFEVTVINRTRERVELDPTQTILRLDNDQFYYCRQGAGIWRQNDGFFDYSYLKWSSLDGITEYFATWDRDDIWRTSEYLREKPVRKGAKYVGKLTFPRLPAEVKSVTLEIRNFILAFDRFEVGYGNPTKFTDLAFHFKVHQEARVAEKE